MAKSQADALFDRLRANGLRKRVARDLSNALGRTSGSRASKAANGTITELRKLVAELEDRAKGGPDKRKAAARKAANTRKRKAAQRSAAAKKAAKTRAKSRA
jgi:molecular chaperone GrpE (heat shock protein)